MSDEKIRLIFEKCPRDKANDKKLKKYMRSSLYEIKVMDGNEKTISNLLKED